MKAATLRSNPDPLLNDQEAAAFLNIGVGTLSVWRCTGRYAIPYVKVGRLVRYRQSDLAAFIERRRREVTP